MLLRCNLSLAIVTQKLNFAAKIGKSESSLQASTLDDLDPFRCTEVVSPAGTRYVLRIKVQ
eukprot:2908874-Pleurochrysis_carterae.AAC.1